jgi:hypothetical protein
MAILGKNLHARPFIPAITNNELASVPHDRYFSWIPQLTLLLAWNTKLKLERSSLLKNLKQNI